MEPKMNLQKTAKVSTTAAITGLGLAGLGMALSGGFGPCGPQHPEPFIAAMFGVLLSATGILGLVGCSIVLLVEKLRDFASAHRS